MKKLHFVNVSADSSARTSCSSRNESGFKFFLFWATLSLFVAFLIVLSLNSGASAAPGGDVADMVIEGEVEIIHIDEFEKGKSRFIYFLRQSGTDERVELSFANQPPRSLRPGSQIIAHGRSENGKFQVSEIIAGLNGGSSTTEEESTVAEAGTGIHHAIVMILNMPNSSAEATYPQADDPGTPEDESAPLYYNNNHIPAVEANMFTNNFSVDTVYREASFDQLSFPADMGNNVVLLEIPYVPNFDDGALSCDYYSIASMADQAATDAGINLGAYHNKMYLVPPESISDCKWLALGQVGSYGGTAVRLSWSTRNDTVAYAHEFGHNLGWHHAGTDPDNDGVWNVEYGDQSSIMGYCCGHKKFNSVNVDQIGWYDSAELAGSVLNVLSGGIYTIAPLGSDPVTTIDPQILKVDKPNTNEVYFVSFRKKVGLDANMSSSYTTGASVHHARETGNKSYLIDVLDNGSGNQFVDSVNGIIITQLDSTVDYVTVDISFDFCATQAPSVAIGPSNQMDNDPGDGVSPYTVTITNNDSQGCEGSTFDLATDLSGLAGSLVDTSVILLPAESTETTLNVQTDPNTADGSYTLTVLASDLAQPQHDASGQAGLQIDTVAPNAPPNLAAVKKKVKGKQSTQLTWNAASDTGSGVNYYTVYRDGANQGTTSATSFVDQNYAVNGTVYEVSAMDMAQNESSMSQVTFTDSGSTGGKGGGNGGNDGGGGSEGDFCTLHPNHKKCK